MKATSGGNADHGPAVRFGPLAAQRAGSSAAQAWQMLAGLLEASRVIPATLRAPCGSMPLTILSGFLGAGKTTLLNRLLQDPGGRRLAVLVNDFGRINVDAALVRSRTEDMISLANGCVCCTVATELTHTLIELAERSDPPDALVLEASGLADPRGIAQIALANPALRLDGVLTLVDAGTLGDLVSAPVAETIAHQLDAADLIVLTKTDEIGVAQQQQVRSLLAARCPATPLVTANHGELPASVVLGVHSARDRRLESTAPLNHGAAFESWSMMSAEPLDGNRVQRFVDALPHALLRAKGIFHLTQDPSRRHVFQRVGRRSSLVAESAWGSEQPGTMLVLIGPRGCIDDTRLQREFAALATEPVRPA